MHKLQGKLIDKEVAHWRAVLAGTMVSEQLLAREVNRRRIGLPAARDARPLKIQHRLESNLLTGAPLATV